MKIIYLENMTPIGVDLELDYEDPSYQNAMDYLEGRVKPNYLLPTLELAPYFNPINIVYYPLPR